MSEMPKEFFEVYKYVSFDIGEAIVSNNSLKFTNPRFFNDPFDCDIAGLYFDLNDNIDPKVKSEIEQLKKQFPYDKLSEEKLAKVYEETIKDKLIKSVVTCFSLDRINHLMWSHYANNHTGMCLGFDNTIPIKNKFIDIKLGIEGEMVYGFEQKANFCADKITGNQKLYLTKLKPWDYEKEYRYIAIADEGIYHFPKEFLKEIILGLRVKEEQVNRIIRLRKRLNLHHVKILKTEISGSNLIYVDL